MSIQELKNQLSQANSILVLTPEKPSFDAVASALAMYLSLKNAGKNVSIASSSEPIVRDSHLVGLDKIQTEIGNTNLAISFPYKEDSIEKVSYNVEGDHFKLLIQPKEGFEPIKKENLSFNYTGASADLVIIIGASRIEDVGNIILNEKNLLEKATIVNISDVPGNFGKINLVDPNSSLSEIVTAITQEASLQLTKDAAQNLMQGIEDATQNLQSTKMTADTFEALALLCRVGARRSDRIVTTIEEKESAKRITQSIQEQTKTKDQEAEVKPKSSTNGKPKPDWLKPKIYKGSTKV